MPPDTAVACRWCGHRDGWIVLDLNRQPSCDHFPPLQTPPPDACHPLRMWLCAECGLAQLAEDAPLREPPLGQEPLALVEQAAHATHAAAQAGLLPAGARVVEAGSPHGGSWLGLLRERGLLDVTDDPDASADVLVDVFGMMHEADQREALRQRVHRLEPDGVLLLQYHSLATIVAQGKWNALRHGHFAYYSTTALEGMLRRHGLAPVTAWRFPLYGGTVLLAARRGGVPDGRVEQLMDDERALGVTTYEGVSELGCGMRRSVDALRRHLIEAAAAGRTVLGYAAASSAVPLLTAGDIGPDLLPAVADASPAKWGRALPGSRIPIIEPAELVRRGPTDVLLFVPDMLAEVRAQLPEIEASGGRWLTAEPELTVVPPAGATSESRSLPRLPGRPSGVAPGLIGVAPPPVTVGLPVRNGERYLQQALSGLLSQDYVDFELWVADNASTDATPDIVRSAQHNDARIRYQRRERDIGVTENHNRLAWDASSPMFMWASSDDDYHPRRLASCVKALRDRPNAVLAFTAAREIDGEGATIGSWLNPCRVDDHDPVARLADLVRLEHDYSRYFYGLYRQEALLSTGLLPPVKNSDAVLIAELALSGPFADVREALLLHRVHGGRLTAHTSSRDWYREQRTDGRRIAFPNVEEGLWYLRAVRRSPLSRAQGVAALRALSPWLVHNLVPMGKNVGRALVDVGRLAAQSRASR